MNARALISSALSRLHREESALEYHRAQAERVLAEHEEKLSTLRATIADVRNRWLADEV